MADKEERIFISHYTKDVCSDCLHDHCYEGLCNCDFEYKNGITRKEAIDKMADALIKFKYLNTASADDIEECEKDAEVCLTALLKGGK